MSASPFAIQSFYNQNRYSAPSTPFTPEAAKSVSGTPHLPGYLYGSSPGHGRSLCTGPYQNNSPSKMNSKSPPSRHSGFPYVSPPERKQHRISPTGVLSTGEISMKDKIGAPPTESLYREVHTPRSAREGDMSQRQGLYAASPSVHSPHHFSQVSMNDSVFNPTSESIPQSPAQIDPFYSQGDAISSDDVLDDTAVTVFGFPPAASSFILQQFAQYGAVEKHEIHNAGNWMHLKYQTKIQAKKALSKNGKIFARSIMIGVCPCIKKEIAKNEADMNSSIGVPDTPILYTKKMGTMRPLSSTLVRNEGAPSDILTNENNTPQKKASVVGKALDYVFGW